MTKLPALALALAAFGCSKDNPYYCEGNPDDNCALGADAGGDGPQACTTSASCGGSTPVCHMQTCVPCSETEIGACGGMTPVCSAANTCEACTAHAQCGTSTACLPDGACGDDTTVAYVASTGSDANDCTKANPCASIPYAATKGKDYVKVEDNLSVTAAITLTDQTVRVLAAPDTTITRTTTGPIFLVAGTSNVELHDLTLTGALGTTGHGISVASGDNAVVLKLEDVKIVNNDGKGLSVLGGSLTMERCLVARNDEGGAEISAVFDISSSMFVRNGTSGSTIGGLFVTPQGSSKFAFNTVALNDSASSTSDGMNCILALAISNTLVSDNGVSGSCTFDHSLLDNTGLTVDGTNIEGDPMFVNMNGAEYLMPDFFRIQLGSAALDTADDSVTMMSPDIDGDERPQGNGPDIGADEFLP